jgi:hypothetical protein
MQHVALGADDKIATAIPLEARTPVVDLRALLRGRFGAL